MDDYYKILGVPESATIEEIKKAYRKKASVAHPDKGGDTAEFQRIQAAYDTLGNSAKKSVYDRQRSGGFKDFNRFYQREKFRDFDDADLWSDWKKDASPKDEFKDLLEEMVRRRSSGGSSRKNKDVAITVRMPLKDTLESHNKVLTVNTQNSSEVVTLAVPRGIKDGEVIKYPGLGDNFFKSLPRGDLIATFQIDLPEKTTVDKENLFLTIDIDCLHAIIGCKHEFTTFEEKTYALTIPPGTQSGTKFKVVGQGLYAKNSSSRGDLYLVVNITIPTNLSPQQVEIIRQALTTQ